MISPFRDGGSPYWECRGPEEVHASPGPADSGRLLICWFLRSDQCGERPALFRWPAARTSPSCTAVAANRDAGATRRQGHKKHEKAQKGRKGRRGRRLSLLAVCCSSSFFVPFRAFRGPCLLVALASSGQNRNPKLSIRLSV